MPLMEAIGSLMCLLWNLIIIIIDIVIVISSGSSSKPGFLQDEDFVLDKDDEGSPTDDSGGEESDVSESGDEKEVSN